MDEYTLSVEEQDANKRLDVLLISFALQHKLGLSRTALQKIITQGHVSLNGITTKTAHHRVKSGQCVTLHIPDTKPVSLQAEDIPLDIIYEDEDLAVIDKPTGLVVHPAPGNSEHTLVNALLRHIDHLSTVNPLRPGIVHRLDKETSGVMVVAKNNDAHLLLAKQFAEHSIKRTYIALVQGRMEFNEQVIEVPIERHPTKRQSMSVGYGEQSRYARTYYKTIKRGTDVSFLELSPQTGRTHQLRVHLAFIGHPILGDAKYGKNNAFSRMALHALYLGFTHPRTGTFVEFKSCIPKEFSEYVKTMKASK